jgi:hypothetical protein
MRFFILGPILPPGLRRTPLFEFKWPGVATMGYVESRGG